MTIYNVIKTKNGVEKMESFPVIDEQLSGEALGEAIECFKKWVKEVVPDIDDDELEECAEEERFDSGGIFWDGYVCVIRIQIIRTHVDC